jgi:predicted DNA-binding protein (UPF0278 family)
MIPAYNKRQENAIDNGIVPQYATPAIAKIDNKIRRSGNGILDSVPDIDTIPP